MLQLTYENIIMTKESKNENWETYLELIIGLILLAVVLPLFVYLISFKDWGFDLTDKGTIGDAIGGITAPIIGIIGAILVYLSFRSQVIANKLLSNQNDFRLLIDLINELKKDVLFLYDRNQWNKHALVSPFLAYIKNGNIKDVPAIFKRKLLYVFNDYIFLSKRLHTSKHLIDRDITTLTNSLENLFDCYLDNYCIAYDELNLEKKPSAKLSKKLQELADEIIQINKDRPIMAIEDNLD